MPLNSHHLLVEVALDLANSLNTGDRFDRLLGSIRKAIACDAVVLLGFRDDMLTPLAMQGLSSDVLGRRFLLKEHPRLQRICDSSKPLLFANDCDLPDPYDGLLVSQLGNLPIHSCMGLPLYSDDQLIGVVTLDSLNAHAFDDIELKTLELITALSAATLKTALEFKKLELSAHHAQEVVKELTQEALLKDGGEIIGQSPVMQALKNNIELVSGSNFTVLITGETGVGKELVARKIHQLSDRKTAPLVYLNCASLPESLVESELFGHTKGAFTGADKARAGKFQLANGGTLFLDEVGELPLSTQSKLLRVLQSGEIQPVGQDKVEHVDVRIIAATNRNLEKEVENEQFRSDLYHRLMVYPIHLPSLKDRGDDVLLLAGYFLERISRQLNIRQLRLTSEANTSLLNYSWPGNVRELEHVISRAALRAKAASPHQAIVSLTSELLEITADKPVSSLAELDTNPTNNLPNMSLKAATEAFQKRVIAHALQQAEGNWAHAAKQLQMDRSNLIRMAKRLNITVQKNTQITFN
ncbi:nitric oxide reductase transcriptional regulator NorR [Methylophaga sulfidovorans]|uniref:Anaerobic nitric oxide reductase transcription regulator n=1 Tax=Methylophaga sulfidovorans TaxID=45496 RepID=A0A1I3UJH1_9GAMM|nr:nitric oxide reductase transcriptional regulator NorR [Methylophaga sulfidovorans]SFJ83654.1 anaerobic nitric oxide reductase transcription regulator [Methylophaga sulfidovorans]